MITEMDVHQTYHKLKKSFFYERIWVSGFFEWIGIHCILILNHLTPPPVFLFFWKIPVRVIGRKWSSLHLRLNSSIVWILVIGIHWVLQNFYSDIFQNNFLKLNFRAHFLQEFQIKQGLKAKTVFEKNSFCNFYKN